MWVMTPLRHGEIDYPRPAHDYIEQREGDAVRSVELRGVQSA